jgi:hypothetical protein
MIRKKTRSKRKPLKTKKKLSPKKIDRTHGGNGETWCARRIKSSAYRYNETFKRLVIELCVSETLAKINITDPLREKLKNDYVAWALINPGTHQSSTEIRQMLLGRLQDRYPIEYKRLSTEAQMNSMKKKEVVNDKYLATVEELRENLAIETARLKEEEADAQMESMNEEVADNNVYRAKVQALRENLAIETARLKEEEAKEEIETKAVEAKAIETARLKEEEAKEEIETKAVEAKAIETARLKEEEAKEEIETKAVEAKEELKDELAKAHSEFHKKSVTPVRNSLQSKNKYQPGLNSWWGKKKGGNPKKRKRRKQKHKSNKKNKMTKNRKRYKH